MINIDLALKYKWGDNCLGWHLVDTPQLSVIQEKMPPGTFEMAHKHSHSQQFFFILHGVATFKMKDRIEILHKEQGIHILPGEFHRISNESEDDDLHFLVISQPHSHGDRINL